MNRIPLLLLPLALSAPFAAAEPEVLKSPTGKVVITFALTDDGAPAYSVSYAAKPVVADSRLGLTLRQTGPLAAGFRVLDVKRASRDERYPLVAGKTREGHDRCEEMTVALEKAGEHPIRLDVVFRAFDDGAAFRYVLPVQEGLPHVDIVSEDSRFRFLADHQAWVLQLASFTTSNEREFVPMPLLGIKPESIVGPPLTIEAGDGLVVSLAEANLRKWSGLHFARVEGGNDSRHPTLITKLAPLPSNPGIVVRGAPPMQSPWRVLMLGAKPGDLVESTILTNLADPDEIGDTSWIKPGKVAWDWWSGPVVPNVPWKAGMNDETFRYFIDFASEFGLEYVLIDAGWYGDHRDGEADITRSIPGMDIPALVEYGKGKNVRLMVWLNWETVRDHMDVAFPLYEKWGLAGVKVDYMDRKDQEIVAFYQRAARTAARYHLVIDFHGAYAGSGEERTFPNWLTREGVMGLEYLKWSDRTTPRHNVTIPFTRMLLGPMDYTPGGFRNVSKEAFVPRNELPLAMGTRAHQLAMYVVYDSPLQMLSDTPPAYRGQPGSEFLKVVPTTWDETKVLDGKIGEYVVIARRHGDDWFVGAMTDLPRKVAIPLGFLGGATFDVTIWADTRDTATDPTRLSVLPARLGGKGSKPLELSLADGGGAVLHLRPVAAGKGK
jgi:alpha-glucosidase